MVEQETVRKLLETIEARLERLEKASDTSMAEYREDSDLQDIVERNFEVMIQACIDLGLHVLADEPKPLPQTNRAVFPALSALDLIGVELASRLERIAGFRNLLAHDYARLLPDLVHANLGRLEDIRVYLSELMPAIGERNGEGTD